MTDNIFMTETHPHLPENASSIISYEQEEERPAYLARALTQPGKFALDFSIFLLSSLVVLTPVAGLAFFFSIWIIFGGYEFESAFIRISILVIYLGFVAACITNLVCSIFGFSRADRNDNPESGKARYRSSIILSTATLAWLFGIFLMSGGGNLIALLFTSQ